MTPCAAIGISLLSKFRRPRPEQSEPSQESRVPALRRNSMIQDAATCDKSSRPVSCGVLERHDRNSNRGKSKGILRLCDDLGPCMARHEERTRPVGIQHGESRRYV